MGPSDRHCLLCYSLARIYPNDSIVVRDWIVAPIRPPKHQSFTFVDPVVFEVNSFTSRSLKSISRRIPNWLELFFLASWTARTKRRWASREKTWMAREYHLSLAACVASPLASMLNYAIDRLVFVGSERGSGFVRFPITQLCLPLHRHSIDAVTDRQSKPEENRTGQMNNAHTKRAYIPVLTLFQRWFLLRTAKICFRHDGRWEKLNQVNMNDEMREEKRRRTRKEKMNHWKGISMTTILFYSAVNANESASSMRCAMLSNTFFLIPNIPESYHKVDNHR